MKTMTIMLAALFMLVSSVTFAQNKNSKEATAKFKVSMSCHNCKAKIEKNIAFEKGVKDLKVDLENKTVTITYRTDKTNEETLKKAIEKLNFTCEEVPAEKADTKATEKPKSK